LHYTASRQQHLWALLGMKMNQNVREQQVQPISEEDVQPLPDFAPTRQTSRVGEQQPVRLEVGEPQDKGSTENCPFSGTVVELQSAQIRATGVEKLQCPACGAARKATIRGELVIYPPHTPLRITRANKGPSVDQARDNLDQEVARSAVDAPGSFAGSLTLMLTHSQAMLWCQCRSVTGEGKAVCSQSSL
jgi:hypothetical protein